MNTSEAIVELTEVQRLRGALEAIIEKSRRSRESLHPGTRERRTKIGNDWHDGFVTALATCSIMAHEALDPDLKARDDEDFKAASGTDREWFDRTGNCGHCGNSAEDCVCTDSDPCGCGPHSQRTWPRTCWHCSGTGQIDPVHKPAPGLSSNALVSLVLPAEAIGPSPGTGTV